MTIKFRRYASLYEVEQDESVQMYTISCFDHWLNESEAEKLMVSFAIPEQKQSEDYLRQETKLLELLKSLFEASSSGVYEISDFSRLTFKRCLVRKNFLKRCTIGLRELQEVAFFLESFNAFVVFAYDLQIPCYFVDESGLQDFQKLVSASKLFMLK